ncbi:unnamed protein product [Arctogadus glacialis]
MSQRPPGFRWPEVSPDVESLSQQHRVKLNSQVALQQIIQSQDEDPAAQSKQLTLWLQQINAALENKVTDL